MAPKRIISRDEILKAMKATGSNRAASRYVGVSYKHYRIYAQLYTFYDGGPTLWEIHCNKAGRGVPKFLKRKNRKEPILLDIIEGRIPIEHFNPHRIKQRLFEEGYLMESCYCCGFADRRPTDLKSPMILNFKDKNKKNYNLDNLEVLCYNCFFIYVGDVINNKRNLDTTDDYTKENSYQGAKDKDWELSEEYIENLKSLGLWEDQEKIKESDLISRKT